MKHSLEQWLANCWPRLSCGPLSNFEWAAGYLLLFQFYKVVVGFRASLSGLQAIYYYFSFITWLWAV